LQNLAEVKLTMPRDKLGTSSERRIDSWANENEWLVTRSPHVVAFACYHLEKRQRSRVFDGTAVMSGIDHLARSK